MNQFGGFPHYLLTDWEAFVVHGLNCSSSLPLLSYYLYLSISSMLYLLYIDLEVYHLCGLHSTRSVVYSLIITMQAWSWTMSCIFYYCINKYWLVSSLPVLVFYFNVLNVYITCSYVYHVNSYSCLYITWVSGLLNKFAFFWQTPLCICEQFTQWKNWIWRGIVSRAPDRCFLLIR